MNQNPAHRPAASSFHRICGDEPLSLFAKGLYTLSFLREKLTGTRAEPGMALDAWRPVLDEARLRRHFGKRLDEFTSNRVLCSDFLAERAAALLGEGARLLDLGCGPGEYSVFLASLLNYRSYLGIDVVPFESWARASNERTSFRAASLGTVPIDVSDIDAVFSISALEHMRFDKQVLLDLHASEPRRLRHLHLIPGVTSFFQYRAHGYRRYTLAYVRALVDLPGISNLRVHALGNAVSRRCVRRDGGPSAFSQLLEHQARLVPDDARDAPFLAVSFEQTIGTRSSA
jgi:SAM-dependent methyltransferase